MKKSLIFYFTSEDFIIYDETRNKIYKEKNYIANKLYFDNTGYNVYKKNILAFGNKAYEYCDKTPYDIEVVKCMNGSKIVNLEEQSNIILKMKDKYKINISSYNKNAYILTTRYTQPFQFNLQCKATKIKSIKPLYIDEIIAKSNKINSNSGSIVLFLDNDYSFIMTIYKEKILFVKQLNITSSIMDEILKKYIKFNTQIFISSKQASKIREIFDRESNLDKVIKISAINNLTGLPTKLNFTGELFNNINSIYLRELTQAIQLMLNKLPINISRECIKNNNILITGTLANNIYIKNVINKSLNIEVKKLDFNDILFSNFDYGSNDA